MAEASVRIDEELDLRGEVCPYTFVKSKLAIEEMEENQVLRITLDHQPAVVNVPRSLTNEGHEVLDVTQVGPMLWTLTVKKKA